ncbi:hypothetical protein ACOSQ4_013777 [Xanthoceras sorbifolium]
MKVEVSDFMGRLDPDTFDYWIMALEDYFDWFTVPKNRKVQFVKLKLKGPARLWWSSTTVDQYTERFHELTIRSKTNETEAQVLARYLKGLKVDIRKEMLTACLYNVEEAYQLALQLERQSSSRRFPYNDSGNFRFPTSTNFKPSA